MTNSEYINTVLHCIKHETIGFLQNDMLLTITDVNVIKENLLKNNTSSIELKSDMKFTVIISIDNQLFDFMFNKFFIESLDKIEKQELEDVFSDEIINIVVGLAIRYFPKELNDFELSVPYKLNEDNIEELLNKNISQSLNLKTNKGNFIYTVIYN